MLAVGPLHLLQFDATTDAERSLPGIPIPNS